jgi:hypothetical protein
VNFTDASGDGLTACHRTRTLELQILKRIRRNLGPKPPQPFRPQGEQLEPFALDSEFPA